MVLSLSAQRWHSLPAASDGDGKEEVFVLSRESLQAMMDDAVWSNRLKAFGNALLCDYSLPSSHGACLC